MTAMPEELIAYHSVGCSMSCEIPIQPWICEFWPIDEVMAYNKDYDVAVFAPGYLGFATSGGGEMYAFSPRGTIVCLAFVGMSPEEELPVASSWNEFQSMLQNAL
jgi:hypothetical protein